MLFSTPIFLFLFLPVVLLIYHLLPNLRARNFWLLGMSLFFYAWGELGYLLLLLFSVLVNFGFGMALDKGQNTIWRRWNLFAGISFNLLLLGYFKYFNWGMGLFNQVREAGGAQPISFVEVMLPLGISFFTFHALSYLIDIYQRKRPAAARPWDVALYIFFFPQLIAGPILRWHAIAPQLEHREHGVGKFAEGVKRFILGLAKKVLIANTLALPVDQIFALPASQLSMSEAWLGAIGYTLQIYYDFSGYSDMAVGLGKMFGFQFMENFDHPYVSQSIREFWRRWHISLSTWFRDYLYIPLGGSRVSNARNQFNLLFVFFLCGLWHGASATFVVWGLYHGLFLVLERSFSGNFWRRIPRLFCHAYALGVIIIGWVLFRSADFAGAVTIFHAMAGLGCAPDAFPLEFYANGEVCWALLFGALGSAPVYRMLRDRLAAWGAGQPAVLLLGQAAERIALLAIFFLTIVWLVGATYNPFIYFRF